MPVWIKPYGTGDPAAFRAFPAALSIVRFRRVETQRLCQSSDLAQHFGDIAIGYLWLDRRKGQRYTPPLNTPAEQASPKRRHWFLNLGFLNLGFLSLGPLNLGPLNLRL